MKTTHAPSGSIPTQPARGTSIVAPVRVLLPALPAALLLALGVASLQPATAQIRLPSSEVRSQVARLSANDQRQDIRLYNLEKDVDYLQKKVTPPTRTSATVSAKSPAPSAMVSAKSPVQPLPHTSYNVRSGDTLWRIAMNHRVSPGEIMQLNGMRSDAVKTGQSLKIPAKGSPPTVQKTAAPASTTRQTSSPPPAGGPGHTVQKGETFSQIAEKHGVTQSALQQANPNVNPNVIMLGSRLNLPAGGAVKVSTAVQPAPSATTSPTVAASAASTQRHTVRPGDTLSSIASAHRVSISAIQRSNSIPDPNRLNLGQVIVIPTNGNAQPTPVAPMPQSPAPVTYPLSSVSTPPSPPLPVASSPGPAPQVNHRGVLSYRVHSTDTIESIASTFGTTPEKIREINRKPPGSKVAADEEILVPGIGAVGL